MYCCTYFIPKNYICWWWNIYCLFYCNTNVWGTLETDIVKINETKNCRIYLFVYYYVPDVFALIFLWFVDCCCCFCFFFVIIIIIIGIEMGSKTCEKLIYNLCPIFYNRIGHKWQSEHISFPWHHEILYVDVVLMPYLIASFFKYIILVTNAQSKRTFK